MNRKTVKCIAASLAVLSCMYTIPQRVMATTPNTDDEASYTINKDKCDDKKEDKKKDKCDDKKQEDKKKDKVLTDFEYFDYAVFKQENNKIEEVHLNDVSPRYGALDATDMKVEEQVDIIKKRVGKDTVSDVVLTIIYQMVMSQEGFDKLKSVFSSLSDEEIILNIYKQNLYNSEGIAVRMVLPVIFNDRINTDGLYS